MVLYFWNINNINSIVYILTKLYTSETATMYLKVHAKDDVPHGFIPMWYFLSDSMEVHAARVDNLQATIHLLFIITFGHAYC